MPDIGLIILFCIVLILALGMIIPTILVFIEGNKLERMVKDDEKLAGYK